MSWPAGAPDKMTMLGGVYQAHKSMFAAKNVAEWADRHPEYADTIHRVRRIRRELSKHGG